MSGFPPRRLWRIATLTLALATYVCAAEAQPQPRRTVLVVHWSPEEFPINPRRDAAIREVLLAPSETIDYFAEYPGVGSLYGASGLQVATRLHSGKVSGSADRPRCRGDRCRLAIRPSVSHRSLHLLRIDMLMLHFSQKEFPNKLPMRFYRILPGFNIPRSTRHVQSNEEYAPLTFGLCIPGPSLESHIHPCFTPPRLEEP